MHAHFGLLGKAVCVSCLPVGLLNPLRIRLRNTCPLYQIQDPRFHHVQYPGPVPQDLRLSGPALGTVYDAKWR